MDQETKDRLVESATATLRMAYDVCDGVNPNENTELLAFYVGAATLLSILVGRQAVLEIVQGWALENMIKDVLEKIKADKLPVAGNIVPSA